MSGLRALRATRLRTWPLASSRHSARTTYWHMYRAGRGILQLLKLRHLADVTAMTRLPRDVKPRRASVKRVNHLIR